MKTIKMSPNRSYLGFTLIELLVVIAIIGLLALVTIMAVNPFGQIQKARDAQRKSDLKQVQTALEIYYQDKNRYPDDTEINPLFASGNTWGTYMPKVPKDPTNKLYVYVVDGSGTGYRIFASLDRSDDQQICRASNPCASPLPTSCGTGFTCNYVVTSSNLTR